MKSARHQAILDLIEKYPIDRQEALLEHLRRAGFDVTQATVSRDIKELMLIKVPTGDGRYRYAYPMEKNLVFSKNRMSRMFQDSVVGINFSENILVIKTLPGAANAVASTLDYAKWPEIIGTVAGDDNILVVVKPKEAVPKIMKKLEMMIV